VIVWIDAQLSPRLAQWLSDSFEVEAVAIRDLGHRDSEDEAIFRAAGEQGAVIMTKDRDFSEPEPHRLHQHPLYIAHLRDLGRWFDSPASTIAINSNRRDAGGVLVFKSGAE
jgi:predicted nuclease of predicted toxin-antitoxin system